MSADDYELLDFTPQRRLERFGPYLIDRPVGADVDAGQGRSGTDWRAAARFELDGVAAAGRPRRGHWTVAGGMPDRWQVAFCSAQLELRFELRLTDFGQVGVFPEQAPNWAWLCSKIQAMPHEDTAARPKLLNLFAYTGGSTLAAALAGAEVAHVDSARGAVAWARRNAALCGLEKAPIRWIVEDARKFVRRELARGARYDGVILDPPSYGHGPAGQAWKIDRDLPDLLAACAELTAGRRRLLLLTCHTPSVTRPVVERLLVHAFGQAGIANLHTDDLSLRTADGRRLGCGIAARLQQ